MVGILATKVGKTGITDGVRKAGLGWDGHDIGLLAVPQH